MGVSRGSDINEIEKAILEALKQVKPDADFGDLANFIVALTLNGYVVEQLTYYGTELK